MFDVFYSGKKPGLFAHECKADNIEHAQQLSRTRFFWWITYLCDYTDWDWLWEPVPWQAHQRHAWTSQWQKDSETYLVPKAPYTDTNYHTSIISRQYSCATNTYLIDHFDNNLISVQSQIHSNKITVVRYFNNYLDTLKRIARNATDNNHEFVWICSTVCDYKNFDLTWHPEIWQNQMLHVFPSNDQKFGDTFFMHVPTFVSKINEFELLEWYDLNFVSTISVPRRPMPVVQHTEDSHVDIVRDHVWTSPLTMFTTIDNHADGLLHTVSLWRDCTKTIVPLSAGAGAVIVPQVAVPYIKTQLYDYPYINKTQQVLKDHPLDIVFISNGEPNAEINWEHLKKCVPSHHQLHRIDGVDGRVKSEQAAANISSTSFYFRVPAKLKVEQTFDWNWQPDRLQQPKNYIFCAVNPVNNLEYGHMAIVAFNRALTLSTQGVGLDFSMESLHEVVSLRSGIAMFAEDPWTAWRTAFRECIKLKHSLPDVENEYRLNQWCKDSQCPNGNWSQQGSKDALEYYNEVNGDITQLYKSYEWKWLADYVFMKHGLVA